MSENRYRVLEVLDRGKPMTLLLRDDGYRIHVRWLDGGPVKGADDWILWAEYKQCDRPDIGRIVSDVLMR